MNKSAGVPSCLALLTFHEIPVHLCSLNCDAGFAVASFLMLSPFIVFWLSVANAIGLRSGGHQHS